MRTSTPHFQRRQRHRHSGRTANENLPYFLEIEFPTLPQCLAINHCLPASDQPSLKPISMQRSARRMILLLAGVFACLSTVLGPSESLARSPGWTVVRVRLVGHGAFGPNTPVGGMRLTLYNNRFGRSSLVVSRGDGRFAFRNITSGRYSLEVWFSEQTLPENIPIQDDSSAGLRYRHD
jgi:hypothetical protein